MKANALRKYALRLAAFTVLSWIGGYLHNRIELPQLTLLSPENSVPAVISFSLYFVWFRSPTNSVIRFAFLTWAIFQLVGGVVSVIPFEFLPFYPPQTAEHYLTHAGLALSQLPLIVALLKQPNTKNHKNISEVKEWQSAFKKSG